MNRLLALVAAATSLASVLAAQAGTRRIEAPAPSVVTEASPSGVARLLAANARFERTTETQKGLTNDGIAGDNFANSVSIEGDITVLATWLDDDRGVDAGAAYVFERQGAEWVQTAKLLANDGAPSDWLGTAVDLSGNATVVCAVNDDDNGTDSGSAYIFEKVSGSWSQTAKLLASDGAPLDWFGFFAGISGNTAVVTANRDDDNGSNSGSAYVFRRQESGWIETDTLLASDGGPGDQFGYSVSVDGTVIALSSPFDDQRASNAGAVYVFERQGGQWIETAKLVASDGRAGDNLGTSVEVNGNLIFAGARNADVRGVDSGEGYVYQKIAGEWVETARLIAFDGQAGDAFGDVSGSSNLLVVGASLHDANGSNAGAAYLFQRAGTRWFPAGKLLASDGQPGDTYAFQVSLWRDRVVIGAPEEDERASGAGAAYFYDLARPALAWRFVDAR